MVIQISPQTELAHINDARVNDAHAPPSSEEAPKTAKPDKNGLGVFAKILAGLKGQGLLAKTGAGEHAAVAEISGDTPLAEGDEALPTAAVGKSAAGKNVKKAAAENAEIGEKKPRKTGEDEPVYFELSQHEKNMLFSVDRLTGQDRIREPDDALPAAISADLAGDLMAEAEIAQDIHGESAVDTENLPVHANAAGLFDAQLSEKIKNDGEKAKNRPISAEMAAKTSQNTGESAAEGAIQHAEAKNIAATGEKNGKNRLEEARDRDKRRVTLETRDFRSTAVQAEAVNKDLHVKAGAEIRTGSVETSREITLELRLPQGQDAPSAVNSWEAKAGQSFENFLARELHQNFNNDIVRHASVMLRDGNEGTIRLALKPESLGNVKIRLEMAENKITGRIIVESEEALRAFEREIASLEKAFRESGFDGANLEMSLAADGREAQQQWQGTEASPTLPWQFAASQYDTAAGQREIPLTFDFYQQGSRAVNMLA